MSSEHEGRSGPGGHDPDAGDDFDKIVSGWRREGGVPLWPVDDTPASTRDLTDATPDRAPEAERHRERSPAPDDNHIAPDDDHFVPPEPPPLPRIGPPAAVGLALLALGLVLIVAPGLVGVGVSYGLPLGLLSLAAGLGWSVLRLWPDPPPRGDGDGPDDGAVL